MENSKLASQRNDNFWYALRYNTNQGIHNYTVIMYSTFTFMITEIPLPITPSDDIVIKNFNVRDNKIINEVSIDEYAILAKIYNTDKYILVNTHGKLKCSTYNEIKSNKSKVKNAIFKGNGITTIDGKIANASETLIKMCRLQEFSIKSSMLGMGRIKYIQTNKGIAVTGYKEKPIIDNKRLIIPNDIETITYKAFAGSNITELFIGDDVHTIENRAFYQCKNLRTVKLGKNVKYIGEQSFYECFSLKTVIFNDNIEIIDKEAFKGVPLHDICIGGNKLKQIGQYALFYDYDLSHMRDVNINLYNTKIKSLDLSTLGGKNIQIQTVILPCKLEHLNITSKVISNIHKIYLPMSLNDISLFIEKSISREQFLERFGSIVITEEELKNYI